MGYGRRTSVLVDRDQSNGSQSKLKMHKSLRKDTTQKILLKNASIASSQSSIETIGPKNKNKTVRFIRDPSVQTFASVGSVSMATSKKLGCESKTDTFVRSVAMSKKNDPRMRKQNEKHFKQCIDILDSV